MSDTRQMKHKQLCCLWNSDQKSTSSIFNPRLLGPENTEEQLQTSQPFSPMMQIAWSFCSLLPVLNLMLHTYKFIDISPKFRVVGGFP